MGKLVKRVVLCIGGILAIALIVFFIFIRKTTFEENWNAVVVSPEGKVIDSGTIKYEGHIKRRNWKDGDYEEQNDSYFKGIGILGVLLSSYYSDETILGSDCAYHSWLLKGDLQPFKDSNGEWIYPFEPYQSFYNDGKNKDYWVADCAYYIKRDDGSFYYDEDKDMDKYWYMNGGSVGLIDVFYKDRKPKLLLVRFETDLSYPEGSYLIAPARDEEDVSEYMDELEGWMKENTDMNKWIFSR